MSDKRKKASTILDDPADATFARNARYAEQKKSYATKLSPKDEAAFADWVKKNNVPFDPSEKADYDMRGFWKAMKEGDERAVTAVNQNDGMMHFPDYWKTPYHQSFSVESQWAGKGAPRWNDQDQLVLPDGTIVFDEQKHRKAKQ